MKQFVVRYLMLDNKLVHYVKTLYCLIFKNYEMNHLSNSFTKLKLSF